jgi:hypothetical protein
MESQESLNQPGSRRGYKTMRLEPEEARQGATLGHMRYVLGISVALAVVAFAVVYFSYF